MVKNKKIYLINPPDRGMLTGFSGALLFLKSWLDMHVPESKAEYLDVSLSQATRQATPGTKEAVAQELEHYDLEKGALYGITSTTATYQNALQAARAIKERDPAAVIIMGGYHAMSEAQQILDPLSGHKEIDYCALGEGEKTLEALAKAMPLRNVPNIAYRDPVFGLVKMQRFDERDTRQFLSDYELDTFQFDKLDWSPWREKTADGRLRTQFGYLDISIARGCNLHCPFCIQGENKLRNMHPDKKADLLEAIAQSDVYRAAGGLNIHDNDFAQRVARTHELLDLMIARNIPLKWTIQTRVEHFNDFQRYHKDLGNIVEKAAKAGCAEAYFGVENFDPDLAKYLKFVRDTERYLRDTVEAVRNTLEYGIACNINLQLGVPGETEQQRQNNLSGLLRVAQEAEVIRREKGISAQLTVYQQLSVAYPGTAMARDPIRGTILRLPADAFERFTLWEWKREQSGFVEYLGKNFAHGNGGIPLGIIDVESFVRGEEPRIVPEKLTAVNEYLDNMHAIAKEHPVLRIFDYSPHVGR